MGDDNSASLHHIRGAATAVTHRWLITTPQEDELSNDVGVEEISSSSGNRPDATTIYLILLSVLVGMVCLFYAGCLYAIVRDWVRYRCCGGEPPQQEPEDGATDTVVVHEGRVFSVVGDQRRAVLEAIFKETSKLAAEVDILRKRKKRRKNLVEDEEDAKVPQDVEIPAITDSLGVDLPSPARTRTTTGSSTSYSGHDDEDPGSSCGGRDVPLCPSSESHLQSVDHDDLTIQSEDFCVSNDEHLHDGDSLVSVGHEETEGEGILRTPTTSFEACSNEDRFGGPAINLTPVHVNMNRESAAFIASTEQDEVLPDAITIPTLEDAHSVAAANHLGDFVIPENETAEESRVELGTPEANPSERLEEALSFGDRGTTSRQSVTTVASEYTFDDDSTVTSGDIVCPICLCGYKKGDTLIVAKHCTHMYHKDCIFSWLDKRTDCPVCRKDMVTASEKVAMCRATLLARPSRSPGYRYR